jgi:hypothetical protein
MLKKIEISEIGVSIPRLIRLFFRNYQIIIKYTLLGFFLAYVYITSPFIEKATYIASGTIVHNSNTNLVIQNTIIDGVTSAEFSESIAQKLEEDGISLLDGTFLSAATIKSGLSAVTIPNSLRININFTFPDETLSVIFLNEVIDHSITYLNTTYSNLSNGVFLGEYAETSTFEGIPSGTYLAIGALLGLIFGGILGVIFHAFKGTIYSVRDIKEFGISSFYLKMKINSQLTLDRFLNLVGFGKKINFEWEHTKLILQGFVASSSFTTIQNNLESTRNKPEEPLTTLMVTPMPNSSLTMVAFAYARQSSTQGRKTILIDFDLKDVPFTKYLETYNIETKKKASSKEGVTFLSLEENLDLYLPLQDIIPAKVIRDQETEDIITQIKKKYDHIIILGPSLLPDSSNISILSYVNSALIIANASKSTTIDLIESVNLLIDKHLTAIETLVVEEKVLTKFPSLSVIQSWFTFKPKQKPTPPSLQKPTKKK